MKDQEIYDKVAEALLKQGCASVGEDSTCLYRGPNGTRCAIGHLMPDESYDLEFEGTIAAGLPMTKLIPGIKKKNLPLLYELQSAHDNWLVSNIEKWKIDMKRIAVEFQLKTDILEKETV